MAQSEAQILEEFLVAGARVGDRRALEQLVQLRGPKLLSHATRLLGNREDAYDVVQDAWVEIMRGLPSLKDERAFPAWAYKIVTRRINRTVGKMIQQRELTTELVAQAETSDNFHPEQGPDFTDAQTVRAAINGLPPDQAATIALFYLEDLSVAEVALALDVPPGTIKTRLMHARTKLKHALKGKNDE